MRGDRFLLGVFVLVSGAGLGFLAWVMAGPRHLTGAELGLVLAQASWLALWAGIQVRAAVRRRPVESARVEAIRELVSELGRAGS